MKRLIQIATATMEEKIMATSAEKLKELKAKKDAEKLAKAETKAVQTLYNKKKDFDNSKNKSSVVSD